jgi:drug/metabolite transporter superfamily protein YnfA
VLPFWLSIGLLSLAQGAIVALARAPAVPALMRLRDRRWAAIPPLSVLGFVLAAAVAEQASAQGLTYLALGAVPVLAALALGWMTPGARPARALIVPFLFALAWVDRGALPGELSALALSALSCVALGVLLAIVTPPRWLAGGIVAMAVVDAALVIGDLLQHPNDALNAAHPAAGLPRLQSAALGSAVMGYGDLFIAAALGGLLALAAARSRQSQLAALSAALAVCFDLLFLFVDELPATVPVALTLIVALAARRRRSAQVVRAPTLAASAARLPSQDARRAPPAPRAPAGP